MRPSTAALRGPPEDAPADGWGTRAGAAVGVRCRPPARSIALRGTGGRRATARGGGGCRRCGRWRVLRQPRNPKGCSDFPASFTLKPWMLDEP
ncbi:hypothetical protein DAI22_01g087000 [Oryza sativa Japonica Group]|nr:hypothetical protein DAI22_01g087000 [Oryza sativa Japonica Group]